MPARPTRPATGVVRVTEATGSSPRGWKEAIVAAVKSSDVPKPVGVEVQRLWADWNGRRLTRYHATIKVAYRQALRAAKR